jgi:tRNA pseudouridine38-40 synthase
MPDAVTRLLLEYDGTNFAGWARQPGRRTVEDVVEQALAALLGRESVPLTVAGRTDRGVHARGQVASYPGHPAPTAGLNALLPDDVAALACEQATPGFDARRDATSRAYCYRVLTRRARSVEERGRALHWPRAISLSGLNRCAKSLLGTHDFTAFTPTQTEHVHFARQIFDAEWTRACRDVLEFWIEGDSFMRHMNRVLVGTMLEVADGRRDPAQFVSLLRGGRRCDAGMTAPAHGLYLAGVGYGGAQVLEPPRRAGRAAGGKPLTGVRAGRAGVEPACDRGLSLKHRVTTGPDATAPPPQEAC